MNVTPEFVSLLQREREQDAVRGRLARFAACMNACCSTTLRDRLARTFRLVPTSC